MLSSSNSVFLAWFGVGPGFFVIGGAHFGTGFGGGCLDTVVAVLFRGGGGLEGAAVFFAREA